jgi:hypothetical protein
MPLGLSTACAEESLPVDDLKHTHTITSSPNENRKPTATSAATTRARAAITKEIK